MYKRILIPTDGSELSQRAAEKAVRFAKDIGAEVLGFYARPVPSPPGLEDAIPVSTETLRRVDESSRLLAREYLSHIEELAKKAGMSCRTLYETSDAPHKAIIKAAEENNCDLIFMASHGRKGVAALLLGSETTKVLTHCKIPVLVYR